jgi:hypothetical protein
MSAPTVFPGPGIRFSEHSRYRNASRSFATGQAAVRAGDLLAAQPPAAESKRPATVITSGVDNKCDAMLTFERAPKS